MSDRGKTKVFILVELRLIVVGFFWFESEKAFHSDQIEWTEPKKKLYRQVEGC